MGVPITPQTQTPHLTVANHTTAPSVLPNGFTLSPNGNSATKIVKVRDKEYEVTVHFPGLKGDSKKIAEHLEKYTNNKLEAVAEFANKIGLGTDKNLQHVSFSQDKNGNLDNITKHYANKTEQINKNYFANLRAEYAKDPDKLKNLEGFEQTFEKVKNQWTKTHSEPKEAAKPLPSQTEAQFRQAQVNGQKGPPKPPPKPEAYRSAPTKTAVDTSVAKFEKIKAEREAVNKEMHKEMMAPDNAIGKKIDREKESVTEKKFEELKEKRKSLNEELLREMKAPDKKVSDDSASAPVEAKKEPQTYHEKVKSAPVPPPRTAPKEQPIEKAPPEPPKVRSSVVNETSPKRVSDYSGAPEAEPIPQSPEEYEVSETQENIDQPRIRSLEDADFLRPSSDNE